MTDKEAFMEFFRGAIFTAGVGLLLFAILGAMGVSDDSPSEEKFVVVDKYKGCEVVRYTDRSNGWNYLLHCGR